MESSTSLSSPFPSRSLSDFSSSSLYGAASSASPFILLSCTGFPWSSSYGVTPINNTWYLYIYYHVYFLYQYYVTKPVHDNSSKKICESIYLFFLLAVLKLCLSRKIFSMIYYLSSNISVTIKVTTISLTTCTGSCSVLLCCFLYLYNNHVHNGRFYHSQHGDMNVQFTCYTICLQSFLGLDYNSILFYSHHFSSYVHYFIR